MRELALFGGAGGGILGGLLLGWRTVCAVEIDAYCRNVLLARQRDGILEPFPIWDDVRTFDGKPWRGHVDVVTGGFPCQDISCAGKGAGITGERSGLWKEMARIIGEVRPKFAFVENSPMLVSRGLGAILEDLAEMGYDASWGVVSAESAGAIHLRERIFIIAYADGKREQQCQGAMGEERGRACNEPAKISHPVRDRCRVGTNEPKCKQKRENKADSGETCEIITDSCCTGLEISECKILQRKRGGQERRTAPQCDWWRVEPDVVRMVHGIPRRVDRIKALGNAQVPQQMALAWSILAEGIKT